MCVCAGYSLLIRIESVDDRKELGKNVFHFGSVASVLDYADCVRLEPNFCAKIAIASLKLFSRSIVGAA